MIITKAGWASHIYSWCIWRSPVATPKYFGDLDKTLQFIRSELDMKYTHLLELSTTEPRQYRITVIEDKPGAIIDAQLNMETGGFSQVGWYDTPEELLTVLIPYLSMEQGR